MRHERRTKSAGGSRRARAGHNPVIAPFRPFGARVRLWSFIGSFILAFAGITHGLRAPQRARDGTPQATMAMIGAPVPGAAEGPGTAPGLALASRPYGGGGHADVTG